MTRVTGCFWLMLLRKVLFARLRKPRREVRGTTMLLCVYGCVSIYRILFSYRGKEVCGDGAVNYSMSMKMKHVIHSDISPA